jgi:hypothetical protein
MYVYIWCVCVCVCIAIQLYVCISGSGAALSLLESDDDCEVDCEVRIIISGTRVLKLVVLKYLFLRVTGRMLLEWKCRAVYRQRQH